MIRTLLTSALSLLLIGFLAVPARAAGPEEDDLKEAIKKLDAKINGLIEAHNKMVKGLDADQKLTESDIKDLKTKLEKLEKYTTDAVTDLSKRVDDLNRRIDKLTPPGARISGTIDPTMGRLNLVNSWDFAVTFNVDNRRYVLAPQQQQVVDVPAGRVMYEIVSDGYGVIHPLQPLDIRPGQALTMQVF